MHSDGNIFHKRSVIPYITSINPFLSQRKCGAGVLLAEVLQADGQNLAHLILAWISNSR